MMSNRPNRLSRRDGSRRCRAASGSLGLAGMLSRRAAAAPRPGRAGSSEVPEFSGQGQAQHRPLHGGRAVAGGHVRSQARAAEVSGTAAALGRPAHRAHDRRSAALAVRVQAVRAGRRSRQQLLPNMASTIDDICVIKSMYTFNPTHTPARSLFQRATSRRPARRWARGFRTDWAPRTGPAGVRRAGPGPEHAAAGWRARASCRRSIRGRASTIR